MEDFNHKKFMEVALLLSKIMGGLTNFGYAARFKGKFLYLDRIERRKPFPICWLTWTGAMDKWEFAIYKYSDNCYDPEEWFFPGAGKVDGTITEAMEAGMEAYPI